MMSLPWKLLLMSGGLVVSLLGLNAIQCSRHGTLEAQRDTEKANALTAKEETKWYKLAFETQKISTGEVTKLLEICEKNSMENSHKYILVIQKTKAENESYRKQLDECQTPEAIAEGLGELPW